MEDIKNSISAEFVLKRQDGSLVDSSDHSGLINYIEGLGMMMPGIEKALKGRSEGEEFDLTLAPEDMYGLRDEENLMDVSTEDFHGKADELEAGMIIEAHTHEGPKLMTVKSIEGDKVILDANHPLAGMELAFSGKVTNSRPASQEEIDKLTKKGCGCGGHSHGDDHECCGGSSHGDDHECCGGSSHGDDHECCGGNGSKSAEGCGCGNH